MQDHILRIILVDNPWLEGSSLEKWFSEHLPERYIPRTVQLKADHRVCLVVGPRQAGKSTLIWKTLSTFGRKALFLNCEEPAIKEWLTSPAGFLADLSELSGEIQCLFLEEIQRLPEAGLFLKGLVDRRRELQVYATGSSSFDLESATRESLAGRAKRHLLLPLSLKEIADTFQAAPALREREIRRSLEKALVFGTYPTVFISQEPRGVIADLVEAFIIRDASDRFQIRHISAFRKLLQLLASQIGNLCTFSEWAGLAGISNDTVAQYTSLLEDTHVVKLIQPFVGGKRAEITRAPKVYFIDNGLRNQLFGGFELIEKRADRGALLENFVFGEIWKSVNPLLDSVRYWRSKAGAEVDFVIESQGRITGCEVKYGLAQGKLTRGAGSFIDAYKPSLFLVVSRDLYPDRQLGETLVKFIRPWEIDSSVQQFRNDDRSG
jgi:predicted AAA+ superfamily ATPase